MNIHGIHDKLLRNLLIVGLVSCVVDQFSLIK